MSDIAVQKSLIFAQGGSWAKNELKDMIQGKTISYKPVGESYNRIVAPSEDRK